VARTTAGYLARVEGRGTMRESPLLQGFATECLERGPASIVVDLSGCIYLDSTFLGCLVGLHQRFGRHNPPRFVVAAATEQRQRLLAPLRLHKVLKLIDEAPAGLGTWLTLCPQGSSPAECGREALGRHVLDCHRHLVDLGGTNEEVFGPIVEQLARELQEAERVKVAPAPRWPAPAVV
jgi:anti-anti-sigma regulatory factor